MNKEEISKAIEVMQAFAEGKTIESKPKNKPNLPWLTSNNPTFRWDRFMYRIKPNYRPFKNAEECWNEMRKHEPFGWVKTNLFVANFTNVMNINDTTDFRTAFKEYTFPDNTPFGIKED